MSQSTRPALEHFDDHLGKGGELLRQRDVAGAKQEFLAALKLRPDDPKALGLLGLAYFQLGSFDDALPIYEKLVELNQNDASYWLNLGLVHLKLGKPDMAIIELAKSRELDPSQVRTVSYLGLAYARQGSFARAYEAFLQANEMGLAKEMERHLSAAERESIARRLAEASEPKPKPQALIVDDEPDGDESPTGDGDGDGDGEGDGEGDGDVAASGNGAADPADAAAPSADAGADYDELDAEELEEISDDDFVERDNAPVRVEGSSAAPPPPPPRRAVTEALDAAEPEPLADDDLGAEATAINIEHASAEPASTGPVFPEPDDDEPDMSGSWFQSQPAIPIKTDQGLITQAVEMAAPSQAAQAGALRVATGHEAPRSLSEFATSRLIRPDDGEHPFEIAVGGELIIRVADRVMSRTEGVIVSGGDLGFEAASRRVRGEVTGEVFGEDGQKKVFVVTGNGFLVASPSGGVFTAVSLDDDILYVRESLVYAFEELLSWENGNVPGSEPKIHVVQFRGTGCVALRSREPLNGVKLASDRIVYVEAAVLAGWVGRVVPRLVPPVTGSSASAPFVECSGEGVILIEDLGATG